MYFLSKMLIFYCYVSLPDGILPKYGEKDPFSCIPLPFGKPRLEYPHFPIGNTSHKWWEFPASYLSLPESAPLVTAPSSTWNRVLCFPNAVLESLSPHRYHGWRKLPSKVMTIQCQVGQVIFLAVNMKGPL